jgi:hypothetical protein
MKRIDDAINGRASIRRDLHSLIGKRVSLVVGRFKEKFFRELIARTNPKDYQELTMKTKSEMIEGPEPSSDSRIQ